MKKSIRKTTEPFNKKEIKRIQCNNSQKTGKINKQHNIILNCYNNKWMSTDNDDRLEFEKQLCVNDSSKEKKIFYSFKKEERIWSIYHRRIIRKQDKLKNNIIICCYSAISRKFNLRLDKNDYLWSCIRRFLTEKAWFVNRLRNTSIDVREMRLRDWHFIWTLTTNGVEWETQNKRFN